MGPRVAASSSLPPKLVMKRVGPARGSALRDRERDEEVLQQANNLNLHFKNNNRQWFAHRPLYVLLLGLSRAA